MKRVVICIDYFGEWPDWFPVFLESCRANPTIDWCIHTDCPIPSDKPDNVRLISMTFPAYCEMVSERLRIRFTPHSPYAICNLRPMFADIHREIIQPYDYFGWSDIDVLYGDLRSIYDDHVLSHNVISSHPGICSGHFCLLRNAAPFTEAYTYLWDWRLRLESTEPCEWKDSLDEALQTALFHPSDARREEFKAHFGIGATPAELHTANHFVEQWSTPFAPHPWIDGQSSHPEVWMWENGILRNTQDGDRTFLYLHLMNFKDRRWVDEDLYGALPTWGSLETCLLFPSSSLARLPPDQCCFRIDRQGIHLINFASENGKKHLIIEGQS